MSSCNIPLMSNADVGKAFNAVVKSIGRDDLDEILFREPLIIDYLHT